MASKRKCSESRTAMTTARNEAIRKRYAELEAHRPRFVMEDMLAIVGKEFFLAKNTIYLIVIQKGQYKTK